MYRTDFWTLWEKVRVGCFKRTASKHVYYLGWNRSPAQVGCTREVLRPGALGRPRGIGWRGKWERGLGWEIHVDPWLIHVNVWQKPLQYCKVISLQLIKKKTAMVKKYNIFCQITDGLKVCPWFSTLPLGASLSSSQQTDPHSRSIISKSKVLGFLKTQNVLIWGNAICHHRLFTCMNLVSNPV